MKKSSLSFIGACLCLATTLAHAADSSTIKVTGRVLDFGCAISSESAEFTVDLLKHSSKQFPDAGSTSEAVPFRIILEDCAEGTTEVKVSFSGSQDSSNTALLKLDGGSNAAEGLGVEILDNSKQPVPINAPTASLNWIKLAPEEIITLPFYARLMATQSPVHPGQIHASATFILEFQ
ncbi:fimbrial protein [Citrobacter sp. JGM124]|uniref:fimbrial protein n=1 Tax=Citrobacter sp. JGM124 TaxID=2799789 RepID=UPI001BADCA3C|nr:fimbrial protein [Citrobacter sp. JGM124]MBS0848170.1 type 1 fimbrial protein [Citrobacter sp. JGM124]